MVGMFPPHPSRPGGEQSLGKTDLFQSVKGKLGVCAFLGKRQMLSEHDWLLELLYLKIVAFMDLERNENFLNVAVLVLNWVILQQ